MDVRAIRDWANMVAAEATSLSNVADPNRPPTEEGVQARFKSLAGVFNSLSDAIPGNNAWEFSDFFEQVGTAVVGAQKRLDEQSRDYLDGAKAVDNEHVLPAVFRIPKISAEMKFSLQRTASKGINLIFYQNKTEASELHQQSVSIEIVAAPPPLRPPPAPELPAHRGGDPVPPGVTPPDPAGARRVTRGTAALAALPGQDTGEQAAGETAEPEVETGDASTTVATFAAPVMDAPTRAKMRDGLARARASANRTDAALMGALRDGWDRVLIFPAAPDADATEDAVLLFAQAAPDVSASRTDLTVWQWTRPTRGRTRAPALSVLYRLPRTAAQRGKLLPLVNWLANWGRRQATHLGGR